MPISCEQRIQNFKAVVMGLSTGTGTAIIFFLGHGELRNYAAVDFLKPGGQPKPDGRWLWLLLLAIDLLGLC